MSLTQVDDLGGAAAIAMATRPADSTLYVGTLPGHVFAITGATRVEVLDLSSLVIQGGGERGLLGMTFSPDGTKLYVHYSATGTGATVVDEFAVSAAVPGVFNVATRRQVLTVPQPQANHNGGSLLFGPDAMLYLALGDGGGGNDGAPNYAANNHAVGGNGQSLATPLGKILRIDPIDPTPGSTGVEYSIPAGNPFVASGTVKGEIWSYGLRNPFRMSFDRSTGDLWVGDVGQGAREEADFVAAGDATHPGGKGANFGWNRREGTIAGPDATLPDSAGGTLIDPIFDVDHSHGDCAIIGGYVYRGSSIPGLVGQYLYTDNCNGRIRALTRSGATATTRDLGVAAAGPTSFAEDNSGELYVLTLSHGFYRIGPP